MAHIVVLDIETKESFGPGVGANEMTPSLVGIWSSELGSMTFTDEELDRLWPILESADLIVGFNIVSFDFPVLKKYYRGDIKSLPVLDLLDDVYNHLGFRLKLDHLLKHNLGTKKIASGLEAIEFYKNGELEKLKEYCLSDVHLTRDLFHYGVKEGKLKYIDRFHGLMELPLTWAKRLETPKPTNLTLPF